MSLSDEDLKLLEARVAELEREPQGEAGGGGGGQDQV